MSLTYGYDLKEGDDMIAAPVQALEMVVPLLLPGAALVNNLPFCASTFVAICILVAQSFPVKYIPSWVPYFSYEPLAQTARRLSEKAKNDPINFVKKAMVRYYCAHIIHGD
jgi:hypothetical protein